MPTYAYACTECDHRFEAVQAFTDSSLSECPECTGRLRKLFSAVGIVFKGSGFYRTDSRKASAASDTASTKDSGSKDSGSKDSSSKSTSDSSSTTSSSSTSNSSSSTSGSSTPAKAAS